jgi:hypothetical protein
MSAITFEAHVLNGLIQIPEALAKGTQGKVHVVMWSEDKLSTAERHDIMDELIQNPLAMPAPYRREEIYSDR